MSEFSEIEQRLFMLVTTVEELTATTKAQQETIAKQQAIIENSLKSLSKATLEQLGAVDSQYKTIENKLVTGVTSALTNSVASVVGVEVKNGVNVGIKDLEQQANSFAKAVNQSAGKLNGAVATVEKQTKNKILAMWGGALAVVLTFMIVFLAFYVPSVDTVTERRAELARLDSKNIVTSTCDGKVCVKIKPKQCNFEGGFCVAETK